MSRLIILTLPMLLLCFVFRVGSQGHADSTRYRASEEQPAAEASPQGGEEPASSSLPRGPESRRLASRATLSPLEKLKRGGQGGRAERAAALLRPADQEELVDQIMAAIQPDLLRDLPEEDITLLRSYVSRLSSPAAREQAWVCWGPGVSEKKAAAFHEAEKLTGLAGQEYALFANQFFNTGRWDRTATDGFVGDVQGLPVTVTWSIVADGTLTPNSQGNSRVASTFRSWISSIYGGSTTGPAQSQAWFEIFRDAFEAMGETCGVRLVYEPNDDGSNLSLARPGILGIRGDIRIAARALDGDSGTLAFAYAPDNGDIVFDSSDATFNTTSSSSLRLFNVIAHELGHSLGLAHVCPINGTKLLEPILTTNFRGPRFDASQSLQRLYGDSLESFGGGVNNDSASAATPLDLTEDETLTMVRLSIDDNGDQDFFRVSALSGQKLSVNLRPGEGTYLEGEEISTGCTNGTNFNSRDIHDLMIQVLAPDGVTELTLANNAGQGDNEFLSKFKLESDGDYFIRISGDRSNAAQLYRADFRLGDRDPEASLREFGSQILAESGSVKNARLDPNETIKLGIEIRNVGVLSTLGALSVTVSASDNVVIFSSEVTPVLDGSETGMVELVFAALGECRDLANLTVEVSDDSGTLLTSAHEFQLGAVVITSAFDEDFDSTPGLPAAWSSEESGGGDKWGLTSDRFSSSLFSVFSGGVGNVAQATLLAPTFVLLDEGGDLTFKHFYDMEANFDGGVLEASRNGGAWFDLIESPAVSVTGGYNRSIRENFSSMIAGQRAWSGNSGDFVMTSVSLPPAWAGESIRLRWRFAHDRSTLSDGWWIDDVKMSMASADCEVHRPALSLALTSGALDENFPDQNALLTLSAELPLAEPVPVTLELSGSAGVSDISGSLLATIPAGAQSAELSLSASPDNLVEGEEALSVSIPGDQPRFAAGGDASEELIIIDLLNFDDWLAQFFPGGAISTGDSDGDGLSEIAEYLLGTDPTSASSTQVISLQQEGDHVLIPLTGLPLRGDATFGVEASSDLDAWAPVSFERLDNAFLLGPVGDRGFFRLRFSLDQ